jgi:hypothetical protein
MLANLAATCHGVTGKERGENVEPVSFDEYDQMSMADLARIVRMSTGHCFHESTLVKLWETRRAGNVVKNPSTGLPFPVADVVRISALATAAVGAAARQAQPAAAQQMGRQPAAAETVQHVREALAGVLGHALTQAQEGDLALGLAVPVDAPTTRARLLSQAAAVMNGDPLRMHELWNLIAFSLDAGLRVDGPCRARADTERVQVMLLGRQHTATIVKMYAWTGGQNVWSHTILELPLQDSVGRPMIAAIKRFAKKIRTTGQLRRFILFLMTVPEGPPRLRRRRLVRCEDWYASRADLRARTPLAPHAAALSAKLAALQEKMDMS